MPRHIEDGGEGTARAGAGHSLPDVLGLKHHDGTPITLESCHTLAARLEREVKHAFQERESLLCNFDGDPREEALLTELEHSISTGRKAEAAWLALAEVFQAMAP